MREFAVHYADGPLQGHGTVVQPDGAADEPPLIQRLPLPNPDKGLRRTMSDATAAGGHAVYERQGHNEGTGEWEFTLVRLE